MSELILGLPNTFVTLFFFLLGSIFGSFANVVILRLPLKESIVWPGSHCRTCQKPIAWFDNVPILSWALLGGKCRNCKAKVSWRYPLVEFIMAFLFAAIFYKVGWSWSLIEYLIFVFGLVVVTFIDFDHMILPDVFTLSGICIGLLGSLLNPERSFYSSLAGVLMGGGFLWAIAVLYYMMRKQEGMGGGDIKLLAWIGAVLGWASIPFVILASSIFGSVIGLIVALTRPKGLQEGIAFGPYLALAAIGYILGGEDIGLWYVKLFLPQIMAP